jgi:hypothetical protein
MKMDKVTAYGKMLSAASAAVEAARAMLPNDLWGDNPDPYEKDEADRLDRILAELKDATIPIGGERAHRTAS